MINVITRIGTDLIVVIRECHLGIEHSMDRIIEEGCNMLLVIEMTQGEEILGNHKTIKVKIFEDTGIVIVEMTALEEVEEGLGKGSIQVTLEGMIEVVLVDQNQF